MDVTNGATGQIGDYYPTAISKNGSTVLGETGGNMLSPAARVLCVLAVVAHTNLACALDEQQAFASAQMALRNSRKALVSTTSATPLPLVRCSHRRFPQIASPDVCVVPSLSVGAAEATRLSGEATRRERRAGSRRSPRHSGRLASAPHSCIRTWPRQPRTRPRIEWLVHLHPGAELPRDVVGDGQLVGNGSGLRQRLSVVRPPP